MFQEILQKITDEIVFLPGATHYGCWINSLFAAVEVGNREDRVVMGEGVVAVVVAKGSFRSAEMWGDKALGGKFCRGN